MGSCSSASFVKKDENENEKQDGVVTPTKREEETRPSASITRKQLEERSQRLASRLRVQQQLVEEERQILLRHRLELEKIRGGLHALEQQIAALPSL
jgi:uncharacterized coiled-coil protein SlyX